MHEWAQGHAATAAAFDLCGRMVEACADDAMARVRWVHAAGRLCVLTGDGRGASERFTDTKHVLETRVKIRKERLDAEFVALLERLQPNADYMRLFKEIVLDVWKRHEADAIKLRKALEWRGTALQRRLDRLEETFIYKSSIDQATYDRQRDKLREEMALAEIDLYDARLDHLDVEGILGFAGHLLTNAARIWAEASLDQRQRLQQVFFPEGLRFDGEAFGTAVTCLAFKDFEEVPHTGSDWASLSIPSWNRHDRRV